MITAIVADDHAVVRRGLLEILSQSKEISVVAEAGSAAELRAHLERTLPDVVVLDLGLPDSRGTALIQELRRRWPALGILVLTVEPEEQYAVRAIRSGAGGYLTKRSAPADLVDAVRSIAAGGRYISESVAARLADAIEHGEGLPHERLSAREYEVFLLLIRGLSVTEAAGELALSRKTVTTYRSRILRKMGVERNSGLTRYAIDHGLL